MEYKFAKWETRAVRCTPDDAWQLIPAVIPYWERVNPVEVYEKASALTREQFEEIFGTDLPPFPFEKN
jgi:hypothetical protein